MRLTLIATLAFLTTAAANAQDTVRVMPRQYPPKTTATHGLRVHTDYDPQYDKTVLQLDPVHLDSTLQLSALVALDGREVTKEADGVVLTFWSTAPQKRFQENRAVVLQLDDAPPTALGPAWLEPNPRPGFSEIMLKSLSLEQWLGLAAAKRATVTVGDQHHVLAPRLLAAIRDFASRMAPLSPTPQAQPGASSRDEAAIRAARSAQNAAIAAQDADSVAAFWTEDVSVTAGLGFVLRGREAYKTAFGHDAPMIYKRSPEKIVVSSKWPLAWEEGTWRGSAANGQQRTNLGGRYSAQWVKENGRWLIRSELFVALDCSGDACGFPIRLR